MAATCARLSYTPRVYRLNTIQLSLQTTQPLKRQAVQNKRIAHRGRCELTHAARIPTASCPDVSVWSAVCVWRPPAGSVAMAVSDCLSHLKGFALSPFHQIACRPSLEELEGFAFSPSHCLLPSVDRFCVISDRFTGSLLCAVHTWVSALIYLSIYLSIANRVV